MAVKGTYFSFPLNFNNLTRINITLRILEKQIKSALKSQRQIWDISQGIRSLGV